jgi:hypothetical protein
VSSIAKKGGSEKRMGEREGRSDEKKKKRKKSEDGGYRVGARVGGKKRSVDELVDG